MAEYVRHKRPPASHPYWARLRDRANPPGVVLPVAVPGVLGMLLGLYAGLMEPMSAFGAVKMAGGVAGLVLVIFVLIVGFEASRGLSPRDRWLEAVVLGPTIALVVFLLLGLALVPLLLWYALFSGLGPWRGMVGGLAFGAGLGGTFAFVTYRQWQQRQKQWPRWERMRAPRQRGHPHRHPGVGPRRGGTGRGTGTRPAGTAAGGRIKGYWFGGTGCRKDLTPDPKPRTLRSCPANPSSSLPAPAAKSATA
jgi:hypothetical protein